MAFLQRTVAAVRQGVVARLNLNATPSLTSLRGFAAASYLDKDEVVKRVTDVIKNFDRVDGSKVTESAAFASDLGLDSLDSVELVMALEEEFAIEIPDQEADKITSVAEAVSYISANPMAK
ncbi:ACP1 [Auxenochlorella protothecoides x Auxenochlorella symbiontica]|uniref:Acyl carrier protein n=2 Tax=Auxenochlorella protothecoides TaxID=3075 RepID=A0A087SCC7_AUXPR|nr:Acyl carrier protein, mitochondrial [Auxenochlorella protothecoides]KFM23381.1 Acyl carrier protein, mitochondrial [Auxenochlorella protothecoides]